MYKPVLSVRKGSSSLIQRRFPSLSWKRKKCHIVLLLLVVFLKSQIDQPLYDLTPRARLLDFNDFYNLFLSNIMQCYILIINFNLHNHIKLQNNWWNLQNLKISYSKHYWNKKYCIFLEIYISGRLNIMKNISVHCILGTVKVDEVYYL